ncbi:MAG: DUF3857 domain-containing protein [Dinghuibacter sp.]|nr:DUF3857 domain-containing protein [Dinghuibacter sp.]
MKTLLTGMFYFLSVSFGYTQTKVPDFGKLSKDDLLMKECPSDKSAPAMVLIDQGDVTYNWDPSSNWFETEKTVRTRIKVFTDKGLDRANVRIRFYSDEKYETVSGIAGYVYNLDNNGEMVRTKLEKEQVFKKKEDDEHSSYTFSLPGVKPGSVFEYRYTTVKKSIRYIDPWVFQDRLPTRLSVFEIELPGFFRYTTSTTVYGSSKLHKSSEETQKNISLSRGVASMDVTRFRYELTDVPALRNEPFMSGFKDYLQRIEFQLSAIALPNEIPINYTTTWEKLGEELYEREIFGGQIKKKISFPELDDSLARASTVKQKIIAIHHFVRNRFEWNGDEDIYALNLKKTAENRNGSTADLNLLLVNLLKHNDIEAWPVLVSTRDHGMVNTVYPFINQFNSVNVVAKDGNDVYFMNAADKYNPTNLVPYDIVNTNALLVDKKNSAIIGIGNDEMMYRKSVSYMGTIDNDGKLSGDVFLSSNGYARAPRVKAMKTSREKYITEWLKEDAPGIEIENYKPINDNDDTLSFDEKFRFNLKINGSGDYLYFNANLFTGLNENPFVSDTRVSEVDFGYRRRISLNARIVIPDNYQLDELPKVPGLMMADSSIILSRRFYQEENTITLRMTLDINRPVFGADEYADFREYYKKLYEMLNEQVVLKKKK